MTGSEPVIYGTFDGETLLTLLAEVDAELAEHPDGEPVHLVIVGGAAMAMLMDARCTGDVDVVSETVTGELREAARRVAQRHGLRPDWINDAAKLKAVNVAVQPERVYSGERLVVDSAGRRYILAMKLLAARSVDLGDCVHLVRDLNVASEQELLDLMESAMPGPRGPTVTMQYFALEVCQQAQRRPRRNRAAP